MDDDTKKNDTPESESAEAEDMKKNGGAEGRAPDSVSDGDAEEALEKFEKSLGSESGAEPVRRGIGSTLAGLPSTIDMMIRGFFSDFFKIRNEPTIWGRAVMAGACLALFLAIWFLTTRGQAEFRIISPAVIGSPAEVFGQFRNLWFGQESDLVFAEMVNRLQYVQHYIFPRDGLMEHFLASMSRVIKGFLLAAFVAIPLGILCGTFKRIDAFLAPIQIFGRNIPIVTLVPLTLMWFGLGEGQKVAFIFISCVAFILFDASRSISDVDKSYLDTAFTLGASRAQVLTKVLVPLAMPDIFNSLRLLFGLAFGYIILAEMIGAQFGIGKLILVAQRRGPRENVYLILLIITLTAFLIDRALIIVQRQLFPYRYPRQ